MKKRFGPLCKKYLSLSEDPSIASRWIQCQNSGCEKWREIKENDNFPLNFPCDTNEIHCVTCETPQDSSCEDSLWSTPVLSATTLIFTA